MHTIPPASERLLPIATPLYSVTPPGGSFAHVAAALSAAVSLREIHQRMLQQQHLVWQQHLLLQFQQAELGRLQQEAAYHRQCAEEAARARLVLEASGAAPSQHLPRDVSPPHVGHVSPGWPFSPISPGKRLAEEDGADSPFSFLFGDGGLSPWDRALEASPAPRFHPSMTPKRLRF